MKVMLNGNATDLGAESHGRRSRPAPRSARGRTRGRGRGRRGSRAAQRVVDVPPRRRRPGRARPRRPGRLIGLSLVRMQVEYFHPWANDVGPYIARRRRAFAEGVEIDISAPDRARGDGIAYLARGEVDVAFVPTNRLMAQRELGVPVVGIAAINQRPLEGLMTLTSTGIRRPRDLEGRRRRACGITSPAGDPGRARRPRRRRPHGRRAHPDGRVRAHDRGRPQGHLRRGLRRLLRVGGAVRRPARRGPGAAVARRARCAHVRRVRPRRARGCRRGRPGAARRPAGRGRARLRRGAAGPRARHRRAGGGGRHLPAPAVRVLARDAGADVGRRHRVGRAATGAARALRGVAAPARLARVTGRLAGRGDQRPAADGTRGSMRSSLASAPRRGRRLDRVRRSHRRHRRRAVAMAAPTKVRDRARLDAEHQPHRPVLSASRSGWYREAGLDVADPSVRGHGDRPRWSPTDGRTSESASQDDITFAAAAGQHGRLGAAGPRSADAVEIGVRSDSGRSSSPRDLDGKTYGGLRATRSEMPVLQAMIRRDGGEGRLPRTSRSTPRRMRPLYAGRRRTSTLHVRDLGGDRGGGSAASPFSDVPARRTSACPTGTQALIFSSNRYLAATRTTWRAASSRSTAAGLRVRPRITRARARDHPDRRATASVFDASRASCTRAPSCLADGSYYRDGRGPRRHASRRRSGRS